MFVAATNIQVHDGVGFTWEHNAHLYYKRATGTNTFLWSPREHRQNLAICLDI